MWHYYGSALETPDNVNCHKLIIYFDCNPMLRKAECTVRVYWHVKIQALSLFLLFLYTLRSLSQYTKRFHSGDLMHRERGGGVDGIDCILWLICATLHCFPFVTSSRAFSLLMIELKTNSAFVIKSCMGVYICIYKLKLN
jgi:hypothetical protein